MKRCIQTFVEVNAYYVGLLCRGKPFLKNENAEKAAYWQNFSSENLHEFRKERIVNSYKYGNFN